tara:strand:- start:2492 stop:2968 length:477 start_codon:yes stop_codon:yes gene_type:complete
MLIGTNSSKLDISSEKQTRTISEKLSTYLANGDIVYLYGNIGSGKTTFVKYLINHLQEKNKENIQEISSPTFNILNEYKVKNLKILHYDLYRLKNIKELENIGHINHHKDKLIFVEWPELLEKKILNLIILNFEYEDNFSKRSLTITSRNKKLIDEFK